MSELILAGDIGGTNARLAIADSAGKLSRICNYPSANYASGAVLVRQFLQDQAVQTVAGCCIAIAGPVIAGSGRLTNGQVICDEAELQSVIGGAPSLVINDFTAIGHALPTLEANWLRTVGPMLNGSGTKAAIGPGTGLGMGFVVPDGERWRVLPSEGGHGSFAPSDPLETEVFTLLQQHHGFVAWETVLCGPGLVNLYQTVCSVWGAHPETLTAADITARALTVDDPVCHQTLEMFCNLLGTAAGNLALTVCATGGVYLAGGILPRIGDFLADSQFRRRFEDRGPLSGYVKAIPTFLVLEPELGLRGAAAAYRYAFS
jgi:glucokinase